MYEVEEQKYWKEHDKVVTTDCPKSFINAVSENNKRFEPVLEGLL